MIFYYNNATVRVSGIENKKLFQYTYRNVYCIEEMTAKEFEREYGENIGPCVRVHYNDGETAIFSKRRNMTFNAL